MSATHDASTKSRPVRYAPDVEQVDAKADAKAVADLEAIFRKIQETTSRSYDHAVRGVHAKGHGVVTGTFEVKQDLPPELAQGLFARPGRYDAIVRISTGPGDILDDAIGANRGMALKILGVEGERLPGAVDNDQDFLMSNGPVFGAKTPAAFAKNLKLLAATTDKAEGLKKAWSATAQALEGALEAVGGKSAMLVQMGGMPDVHPVGSTYFAQVPFRYGDFIAKFSLRPISPNLVRWADEIVDLKGRPDALREEVGHEMIEGGGVWEFCVQLCTDLDRMPIEDPTVEWDQDESPFVPVAIFTVEPQNSWQHGVTEHAEDMLSFSPWHGLADHQPLGAVNRARKPVYEFSAGYRSEANGCPLHQIKQLEDLPT